LEPQSRNWACSIIRDCPGHRGRFYILQEDNEIIISKRDMIEGRYDKEMNILPLKLVES
jgi:hypothetical protein